MFAMRAALAQRAALLLLAALAASGCHDDPTAPFRPLSVTVTTQTGTPYYFTDQQGNPVIGCQVTMTAKAEGTDRAVWEDAVFHWVIGSTARIPADSEVVSASDMRSLWGVDTIPTGAPVQTQFALQASIPFGADVVMHYRNVHTGETKTATTSLSCVPTDANTLTPVAITSVSATPSALQPGDQLTVTYEAKAGAGLWQTAIVLSGAVDSVVHVFPENGAQKTTRTVSLALPARTRLGERVNVAVYALDADLHQASSAVQSDIVGDTRSPTLSVAALDLPYSPPVSPVSGQWAEGDTIHLGVTARDNAVLRWIVYELGAPVNVRDSVAMVDSAVTNFALRIPLPAGSAGTATLTVYARDVAGNASEPVTSAPGAIRIYPTTVHQTWNGSIQGSVGDVALDDRRQQIYVAQGNEQRIAIVPWQSLTTSELVPLPGKPGSIDVTPGGDSLVVALTDQRAIAIVDLAAGGYPVTVVPLAVDTTLHGGWPLGLRIAANGKAIIPVSGGQDWTHSPVLTLDLRSGEQQVRSDATQLEAEAVSRSGDRSVVVLGGVRWVGSIGSGCGYEYLSASNTFTACLGGVAQYSGSSDGRAWVAGAGLFNESLVYVRSLRINNIRDPQSAISSDGQTAYLIANGYVTFERASDGIALERAPFGANGRTVVSADGTTLFTFEPIWSSTGPTGMAKVAAMKLR